MQINKTLGLKSENYRDKIGFNAIKQESVHDVHHIPDISNRYVIICIK